VSYVFSLEHNRDNESEAVLSCTIEHVSLDTSPKYTALSYVWGNPVRSCLIRLDDHDFLISESLYLALAEVEKNQTAKELWVDSICINQDDNLEKSNQVQRMGKNFHEAESVIAWLGLEEDGSDDAIGMLRDLGERLLDIASENPHVLSDIDLINRRWGQILPLQPFLAEYELDSFSIRPNPLSKLLQRPLWERIWIVQEIAVARSVLLKCGRSTISWGQFCIAYRFIEVIHPLLSNSREQKSMFNIGFQPRILVKATMASGLKLEGQPLRGVLSTVFGAGHALYASDPRDFVFASLGLANDVENLELRVDYTKSCARVYSELAYALLKDGNLEFMSYCHDRNIQVGLPSWVPDWSSVLVPSRGGTPTRLFCVSPDDHNSRATLSAEDPTVLQVRGVRVDIVSRLGPLRAENERNADQWSVEWIYFWQSSQDKNSCYSFEERKEAAWRTPIADSEVSPKGALFGLQRATSRSFDSLMHSIKRALKPIEIDSRDDLEEPLSAMPYRKMLNLTTSMRRAFSCAQGYLGLGPRGLMEGDIIVIIYSGDMPFVLRPIPGGRFKLIGEAYVHGIMDGEFLKIRPRDEVFDLC